MECVHSSAAIDDNNDDDDNDEDVRSAVCLLTCLLGYSFSYNGRGPLACLYDCWLSLEMQNAMTIKYNITASLIVPPAVAEPDA